MIKKNSAFTLLEILISMALSSFIMFGLMQSYQNLMNYLSNAREMMQVNRKVCLFFNQLERDITCAFIQNPHDEIKPEKEESDLQKANKERAEKTKKDMTKIEKKETLKKRKEALSKFFLATTQQGNPVTLKDKKLETFGTISFITTNSLQVFGEKRTRYVRVRYELEKEKESSTLSYRLIRKETTEIKNHEMKETGFAFEKVQAMPIRKHIIADGIKFLSVEYVSEHEDKNQKDTKKAPKKEVRSWTWGDKDFSQGFVPQYIEVHIEFWKSDHKDSHAFNALFPVISYPTPDLLNDDPSYDPNEQHKKTEQSGKTDNISGRMPSGTMNNVKAQDDIEGSEQ